jgi:hypothetical protein
MRKFMFTTMLLRISRSLLLVAGLAVGLAVCLLPKADARSASKKVTVTREAYDGFTDAWKLSNGIVDVVVVPDIGRIMAFEWTGRPETSPLYNDPIWTGKSPAPMPNPNDPKTYPTEWHNYGGNKVWASPQSEWPKHQPVVWPPDPFLDTGPYHVQRLPNGVRLTGPVSPYFGVRLIREITLKAGLPQISLRDTFIKAVGGLNHAAFPIGLWSISQVKGNSTIYLPLNKQGLFPGIGYTSLINGAKPLPNWRTHGSVLSVTRPSGVGTKVGVDDTAGWAACLYHANLLFSVRSVRVPGTVYPDHGCSAEVYTNGSDVEAYMELETLGPLVTLKPGQTLSRSIVWRLQRLPQTPANAREAAAAVQDAMKPE